MPFICIAFLILHILIVALCCFVAYSRGVGRSTVRIVYLLVVSLISFFVARAISAALSDVAFVYVQRVLPADSLLILEANENIGLLLEGFIGAILIPIVMVPIFFVLEMLSLCFFKKISTKIVEKITHKEGEPSSKSKKFGILIGLASGILVSVVLLSPIYFGVSTVGNTPAETITYFSSYFGIGRKSDMDDAVESNEKQTSLNELFELSPYDRKLCNVISKVSVFDNLYLRLVTTVKTPDKHFYNIPNELPFLLDTAKDALQMYNATMSVPGAEKKDAVFNACATLPTHFDDSIFIRELSADILSGLGKAFVKHKVLFGFTLPETDSETMRQVYDSYLDAICNTNFDNVAENMITSFGPRTTNYSQIGVNKGFLSVFYSMEIDGNKEDPVGTIEAFTNMVENGNMVAVSAGIKQYIVEAMEETGLDFKDDKNRPYLDSLLDEVQKSIEEMMNGGASSTDVSIDTEKKQEIAEAVSQIITSVSHEHDKQVDGLEADLFAIFLTDEFTKDSYFDDSGKLSITVEDFMNCFGIE